MSKLQFNIRVLGLDDPPSDEGFQGREFWESAWGFLTDYIQPDNSMSLEEATTLAARYWNDNGPGLIVIHTVVLLLARQIPYDHPSQKKLAAFVTAFCESQKWVEYSKKTDKEPEPEPERYFWNCLCNYMYDDNYGPDGYVEESEDPIFYANLQAFIANLEFPKSQEQRFYYSLAQISLGDALIEDRSKDTAEVRDIWVIGAAQYILYQVHIIFDEVLKFRKSKTEDQAKASCLSRWRSRWQKPKSQSLLKFSWENWQAWKLGFATVAADKTVSDTCRAIAEKAADLMALEEKIHDNSAGS